jgi:FAD/FMN-containing dehydrogenase
MSSIAGRAVRAGDTGYEAARRIWNAAIDKRPGMIVRCLGTADVMDAVRFARGHDILVSVRGGGHNVAGRALNDGGLVIDLSEMRGVRVDPEGRTVWAQGGARLGDVDRETHLHGLAVPTGIVSRTGIAGLTLGGGVGWLVRRYGLTCDNVLAFEVVTADGERLVATADNHRDLFWALRGGGGNFGVVTSFLYRAHPVDRVLGGILVHPRERTRELFIHFRDAMAEAPEALGAAAAMITTPDGMPAAAIIVCWSGDLEEGEQVLGPLRAFGPPLVDAVAPMPFPAMQTVLDGAFPDGTHNYWRSSFVPALGDPVIDTIVEHGNRMASPLSGTLIEFYGGAPGRVDPADSAFAQRRAEFNVAFTAQWTNPGETAQHTAWARAATTALEPFGPTGSLLNFSSDEAADAAALAFGPNLKRLSEVKRRYDPTNFFSLNVNVPVATAAQ